MTQYLDTPHRIPDFNYLHDAWHRYIKKTHTFFPLEILKDQYGIYGFRDRHCIILARKEVVKMGNEEIISVHVTAIIKAIEHGIPILVWIHSKKAFYEYDPDLIRDVGVENKKGNALMLNFSYDLGKVWV